MLDASGTDGDWRLQRRTCADSPTNSLLPAGTQRRLGPPQQLLIGLLPRGSVSHWSSISSALKTFKGRAEPQFQPGWKLVPRIM